MQAQIINLLKDLQVETGMSYLFISHDLAVVRSLSDRIAVMYGGKIVEQGPADQVVDRPASAYAKTLLDSALTLHRNPRPIHDELLAETGPGQGLPIEPDAPGVRGA
jgi:peptide/nickel transport system ATP-binding protein